MDLNYVLKGTCRCPLKYKIFKLKAKDWFKLNFTFTKGVKASPLSTNSGEVNGWKNKATLT